MICHILSKPLSVITKLLRIRHLILIKSSEIKYSLSYRLDRDDLLESAIEDINKVIQLDPDKGWYYYSGRFYLWGKLEKENISNSDKEQLLKNIIADYKFCLSRILTEPNAWLDLIAISIISRN